MLGREMRGLATFITSNIIPITPYLGRGSQIPIVIAAAKYFPPQCNCRLQSHYWLALKLRGIQLAVATQPGAFGGTSATHRRQQLRRRRLHWPLCGSTH